MELALIAILSIILSGFFGLALRFAPDSWAALDGRDRLGGNG